MEAARKLLAKIPINERNVLKMKWEPVLGGNYAVSFEHLKRDTHLSSGYSSKGYWTDEDCTEAMEEPEGGFPTPCDVATGYCPTEIKAGTCYHILNAGNIGDSVMFSAVKQANGVAIGAHIFSNTICKYSMTSTDDEGWQNNPGSYFHVPHTVGTGAFGKEFCLPYMGLGYIKIKPKSEMPLTLIVILALSGFIFLRETIGFCLWRRRRNQARFQAQSAAINMKMKSTSA